MGIQRAVCSYYQKGLASSTQRSYQAGQKHYNEFCNLASLPTLPTSEDTLLLFVGHLVRQGLSYASIKVYLSAVRNLHVAAGLHKGFTEQLTPRLELVLKGIKKESAPQALATAYHVGCHGKNVASPSSTPQRPRECHDVGSLLLRCLWFFVAYFDTCLTLEHLAGAHNITADQLSITKLNQVNGEASSAQWVYRAPPWARSNVWRSTRRMRGWELSHVRRLSQPSFGKAAGSRSSKISHPLHSTILRPSVCKGRDSTGSLKQLIWRP